MHPHTQPLGRVNEIFEFLFKRSPKTRFPSRSLTFRAAAGVLLRYRLAVDPRGSKRQLLKPKR